MDLNSEEYKKFSHTFKDTEEEIIVLLSDAGGGAGMSGGDNYWTATQHILAWKSVTTGEIHVGDGRLNWLITEENKESHGCAWPFNMQSGGIYRLRVRDLIDRTAPEGKLTEFYNRFYVLEVLENHVQCEELLNIQKEYREPVVVEEQQLGTFVLNKDYSYFSGEVKWNDQNISVMMSVDKDDRSTWHQTFENLRFFLNNMQQKDQEFRQYAAEQLTELANDWLQDEEDEEITEDMFVSRINLVELAMDYNGDYSLYYNDDDMFWGHIIDIVGGIETGPTSASIAG
ncbi:TPA: DUF2262 domain-containing protein [Escherichia coli]|uniref:DUF2262 domain-containing protein n=1 Tax=Escherichia coli TaxID=562 RepID=UPI0004D82F88|nr:DUF2262 domain-containing protein [Escherichia coli]EGM8093306.1 DUF2262 domain-containing protein [Escherichia coli]EJD8037724.1 DUF2262 domain-containing protein [Escherichia coli]EJE2975436.1 DUF2262 domain-containing protein [Escherichia coli]EJE6846442.1 DUF2262 domain-containing protein [Escherichia coli]EJE6857396.1 DUF2262 domain-containing protein [Escherichia coli]